MNVHLRNEKNCQKQNDENRKRQNEIEDPDDWIYLLIGSFPPKKEDKEINLIKVPDAESLDVKFRYFIPAVFALFNLIYWSIYVVG